MDNIGVEGEQCVHCREVVHSSECPLSEVPLYIPCPVLPHWCHRYYRIAFFFRRF